MNQQQFQNILQQVPNFTDKQLVNLEVALSQRDPIQQIIQELEQRLINTPECPYCHSSIINRHGKTDNKQRYRCKNCNKTFVATTNTPLARLRHKEKWHDYFQCMLEGKVLRTIASELLIDLKTSFRWRHRFLRVASYTKAETMEGIIEADETFFPYSEKGSSNLTRKPRKRGGIKGKGRKSEDWVPVVTVRDRAKNTYEAILPHVTTKALTEELKGKIEADSVLCTDGNPVYLQFSENNNLIHKRLNISKGIKVIEKVFHVQNVNSYHSRLKVWIARFHGVATKYLSHYLGWFRFMDTTKKCNQNNFFQLQQQLAVT